MQKRNRRLDGTRSAVLAVFVVVLCTGEAAMTSGNEEVALPRPRLDGDVAVERALSLRRSVRAFAPETLPLSNVSQLLWAAQGITDAAGRRTAPSAGALYPLEVYVVAGAVSGMRAGLYRYEAQQHRLALASEGDPRAGVAQAALEQDWLAEAPVIFVLVAVYERTERKYGDRAARYVHMEVGHVAQNVYLQASALGLGTTMVGAFRDAELARVLELPGDAKPLALLPVGKPRQAGESSPPGSPVHGPWLR
jgi:SagB-type dehydrogenase family enzyme